MPRYGNSSVSSLLAAAEAARKRQESLEDSIASYEWDLSEKSPEDFRKYVEHLGKRSESYRTSEPQKALEYQKKVTSAQRSLVSAEISRATTQVLYGNMNNRQKYQTITNLYQQAAETGDEALMQRLEGQAARLSVTIQNEDAAAANARAAGAARATAAYKRGVNKEISDSERGIREYKAALESGKITYPVYAAYVSQLYGRMTDTLNKAAENPSSDPEDIVKYQDRLTKITTENEMQKVINDVNRMGVLDPETQQKLQSPMTALKFDPATNSYVKQELKINSFNPLGKGEVQTGVTAGENSNIISRRLPVMDPLSGQALKDAQGNPILGDAQQFVEKFDTTNQFGQKIAVLPNSATGNVDAKILNADLGIKEDNPYFKTDTGMYAYDKNGNLLPGLTKGEDGKIMYEKPKFDSGENVFDLGTQLDKQKDFWGGVTGFLGRNKLISEASKLGLGMAAFPAMGAVGGLAGLFGMNSLQEKVNAKRAELEAKQEADRKARAELSAREAAEAQRVLSTAPGAAAAKPVFSAANKTVKTNAPFNPQYYTNKLPQPQRAQATIQGALQSPFKKNSKLPF